MRRKKQNPILLLISLFLVVLLFAVPALAGRVDINCRKVPTDSNTIVISYNVTGEPNLIRAFALDIYVNQGAKIKAISGYKVGESVAPDNKCYGIFPGSFGKLNLDPEDPNWADPNYTPLADPCDYPPDTKGGLDTNGITVEMGALYSPTKDNSPNAPPASGELLRVTVDNVTENCKLTVAQNVTRGGVVLTNPNEAFDFNSPGYTFAYCLIGGNAGTLEKSDWLWWGRPDCWCYKRQCRGDVNGKQVGSYWVQSADLILFRTAFFKDVPTLKTIPNGICADLNHKKVGAYPVAAADLTIFRCYFFKVEASVPACNAAPVITGPVNFWCNPLLPNSCP